MSNEEFVDLFEDDNPGVQDVEEVDVIEKEVVEDSPSVDVPEKFQGKSFEEVVNSYVNLEKDYGRKSNEVGELRKLTDEILKRQLETVEPTPVGEAKEDVGFDDFYDDPGSAVNKALESNPRLKAIEEKLAQEERMRSHQAMLERHPDADELVTSQEFLAWAQEKPARMKMLQTANATLDVDLADEIFSMYKAKAKSATDEAVESRSQKAKSDLRKATVETGRSVAPSKKVFRRADLIRLKIERPEQYAAMSDEIRQAYADGRVK